MFLWFLIDHNLFRQVYMDPKGFPGGSVVKNPPANEGDTGNADLISGLGSSQERSGGE